MTARRTYGAPLSGDPAYRQLWRLVDGAIAMTFDHHPDYLTVKGRRSARTSLTKRITGTVHGYAVQVAANAPRAAGGQYGGGKDHPMDKREERSELGEPPPPGAGPG